MSAWLVGVLMMMAGLVALIFGGLLAYWWTEPRGSWENQRPARTDVAPLLLTVALLVAWIPWMVVAITVTVVGAATTFLAVCTWAVS